MTTVQTLQQIDIQNQQPALNVVLNPSDVMSSTQKNTKREFKDLIVLGIFALNLLMFMIIGIIGFANGDNDNIKKLNDQNSVPGTDSKTYLNRSPPAVIAGFFVTLGIGMIWLFLFVRYFSMILSICIYFKSVILLTLSIICFAKASTTIVFGVFFLLGFLISCLGAYALFTQRNTLSLIGDLSKQYSSDRKEVFIIQIFSALLLLCFTLYFIFGYAGLMSVTSKTTKNGSPAYELDTSYRNLGVFYIFSYIWIVYCIIHHFKYSLANSISNWYFEENQTLKDNFIDGIYHFGSICFSSLAYIIFEIIDFLLDIVVSNMKCFLCCLIPFINSFRFLMRKYLSCFVILEVGRKNQNYLQSCASVSDYIANKTLQFIIFSWAGDTVSNIIGTSALWGGLVIGVIVLIGESTQFAYVFLTLFLLIIVCATVASLYSSAFEIILYTFAMQIHDSQQSAQQGQMSNGTFSELRSQREVVVVTYAKIQEQIASGQITYQLLKVPIEDIPETQKPIQSSQQSYQQNYQQNSSFQSQQQSQGYPQNYQQNTQFQQAYPSNQLPVPYLQQETQHDSSLQQQDQYQQSSNQFDQQPQNQQAKYP